MTVVKERESMALRDALRAHFPRRALRAFILGMLEAGLSRRALVGMLGDVADERRAAGDDETVAVLTEALDLLAGQASEYALASYFRLA